MSVITGSAFDILDTDGGLMNSFGYFRIFRELSVSRLQTLSDLELLVGGHIFISSVNLFCLFRDKKRLNERKAHKFFNDLRLVNSIIKQSIGWIY